MQPVRDRVILEVPGPGLEQETASGLAYVSYGGAAVTKNSVAFAKGKVAFVGPKVIEEAPEIVVGKTVHYNKHLTGYIDIPTNDDKTAYIVMGPADIVVVE